MSVDKIKFYRIEVDDINQLNDKLLENALKSRIIGDREINMICNINQDAPYLGFYYPLMAVSRIFLNFKNGCNVVIGKFDDALKNKLKSRLDTITEITICIFCFSFRDNQELFEMVMKMKNLKSVVLYSKCCDVFNSDMWNAILEKGITKTGCIMGVMTDEMFGALCKYKKVDTLIIDYKYLNETNKLLKKLRTSSKNAIVVRNYFYIDNPNETYKCTGEVTKLKIVFHNIFENTIAYVIPEINKWKLKDSTDYTISKCGGSEVLIKK